MDPAAGVLGHRLGQLRKNAGLTQVQAASILEMDKQTYGRLEQGYLTTVRPWQLVTLARGFGVSTDYLLGLSDEPAAKGVVHEDIPNARPQ